MTTWYEGATRSSPVSLLPQLQQTFSEEVSYHFSFFYTTRLSSCCPTDCLTQTATSAIPPPFSLDPPLLKAPHTRPHQAISDKLLLSTPFLREKTLSQPGISGGKTRLLGGS